MVRDGARKGLQVSVHREPHLHLPAVRPREQPLVVHGEAPPRRVVVAEGRVADELDPAGSALLDVPRGDCAVHGRADEPGEPRVGVGVVQRGERQHRARVRAGDARDDGKMDVRVLARFIEGNTAGDDVPRSRHACPPGARPRGATWRDPARVACRRAGDEHAAPRPSEWLGSRAPPPAIFPRSVESPNARHGAAATEPSDARCGLGVREVLIHQRDSRG